MRRKPLNPLFHTPDRPLEPPPDKPLPRCPVCGREADAFYRERLGAVVGCGACITPVDVWEGDG